LLTVTLFFLCAGGLKEKDDGERDAVARDLAQERLKSIGEVALRLLGQGIDGRPPLGDEFGSKANSADEEQTGDRRKTMTLQAAFILICSA
jgi:hypothetical protein